MDNYLLMTNAGITKSSEVVDSQRFLFLLSFSTQKELDAPLGGTSSLILKNKKVPVAIISFHWTFLLFPSIERLARKPFIHLILNMTAIVVVVVLVLVVVVVVVVDKWWS